MVKKLLLTVLIISIASSCIAVPGLFTERTLEANGYTNSLGIKEMYWPDKNVSHLYSYIVLLGSQDMHLLIF